ncbi:MAG: endolytic transglycosylase MltG [Oscillospiraceae bacterium]|jgi:UPF0755 protein|nr:endolytic transglycosylase MltG [Oscillospiraceae bacterium]
MNNKNEKKVILKSQKNGCFFVMVWFVFLAFIAVFITRYAMNGINDMLGIGKGNNTVTVDIPQNSNLDLVSKILYENNVIANPNFFKLYSFVTKSTKGFSQGTYELRPNMDYEEILNHIRNQANSKDIVSLTFREGMNIIEISDLLNENKVCDKEDFLNACKSKQFNEKYDFVKDIPQNSDRYYLLEGYLFPDTYDFYRGEIAEDSINRFLNNFQKKIIHKSTLENYNDKVSVKELAAQGGKDVENLIIIASLIQAEAANKEDMYKVSSVIHNRLRTLSTGGKNNFGEYDLDRLRIDSTVWYPYRSRNVVPSDVIGSFKSKYNTYDINGLPPGPICNPGLEAIKAALKPDTTEYYYFCHSASGSAYYAKTNSVHLVNLRKARLI